MTRTVLTEHEGCQLVRYPSGETRIEHPASGTCSVWMAAADVDTVLVDPATMPLWRTDEAMDPDPEAPAVLLRRVIAASGLSVTRWAREVAWRDPRSVRRWLAGETIPPEALRQIERQAATL